MHGCALVFDALGPLSSLSDLRLRLTEPRDAGDAFLIVEAGVNAPEACDWAEMLTRMYVRWGERHGFTVRGLHYEGGSDAGLRSATFRVSGRCAYGLLSAECGRHRLTRISPFDARNRRHTSFSRVDVLPDVSADPARALPQESLRVEIARTGAGGQMVNICPTGVKVTHLPSGLAAYCDGERSQLRNKNAAVALVQAKLARQEGGEPDDVLLRSYVFQPYQLVRDTETGVQTEDVTAVLDGGIDSFILARHAR